MKDETKKRFIFFGVMLMILIFIWTSMMLFEINEEKKEITDLFLFSVEMNGYCAELNNLTMKELGNDFVMYKAREMTNETTN